MKSKNIFIKMVLMTFVITLMSLTSCKKDDGNDATPGGNGGGGGNNETIEINGYEAVDLGLPSGLKWATCNVGAESPEEYGNYYAWGETETKESYTQDNCTSNDIEIDDISGNPEYDAARANWGETWRMPTVDEFRELKNECEWEWKTQSGIEGLKIIGPNGNSIFFPGAGCQKGIQHDYIDEGAYWSSNRSRAFFFWYELEEFEGIDYEIGSTNPLYFGQSVRPVSE